MQKVFYEVNSLDKRCYEEFALTEDLLMEHAALSLSREICKKFKKGKNLLIVCGVGNNGADGIALARLLYKRFEVKLYIPFGVKSTMAKLQLKRAKLLNIPIVDELEECDIIVDSLFGSGLNKDLDDKSQKLINRLNLYNAYKISCDIPSGINSFGQVSTVAFKADTTITMGALKVSLFSDFAKDYVGKIKVANLGVQREIYETASNIFLLDEKDLELPFRDKQDSHKGSFGHLNVVLGCKKGASVIAAEASFSFGAGLVSLICHENINLPSHIMQAHKVSKNCTAIALGMGLGIFEEYEIIDILQKDIPTIIDADLFYEELILKALQKQVVLTPHPKEFCSLLKLCGIEDIDVETLQKNRFKYVEVFCKKYPKVILLLKGANVLISQNDKIYINTLGTPSLAKGGSGDVLSGLIGALLAQGYEALDATISASLAHAIAAKSYKKNSYSLTPIDLIEEVKKL